MAAFEERGMNESEDWGRAVLTVWHGASQTR